MNLDQTNPSNIDQTVQTATQIGAAWMFLEHYGDTIGSEQRAKCVKNMVENLRNHIECCNSLIEALQNHD